MSYNEFELLCISEDIEVGDTVSVEDEDGSVLDMVFLGTVKKGVKLLNEEAEIIYFNAESLEEIGGYRSISGKSENVLSSKEIMRRK